MNIEHTTELINQKEHLHVDPLFVIYYAAKTYSQSEIIAEIQRIPFRFYRFSKFIYFFTRYDECIQTKVWHNILI